MTQILIESLIDADEWNAARWRGTAFLTAQAGDEPPCLAIVFLDEAGGRRIFQRWRERLGVVDAYEELRISIIEGDLPGERAGYTVHLASEPFASLDRARAAGNPLDATHSVVCTRFKRMYPEPGAPHLQQFKEAYRQHGCYFLIPATYAPGENLPCRAHLDLAIAKRRLYLRQVGDIGENDLDIAVLTTEAPTH
jgi:hypothetical protein